MAALKRKFCFAIMDNPPPTKSKYAILFYLFYTFDLEIIPPCFGLEYT